MHTAGRIRPAQISRFNYKKKEKKEGAINKHARFEGNQNDWNSLMQNVMKDDQWWPLSVLAVSLVLATLVTLHLFLGWVTLKLRIE